MNIVVIENNVVSILKIRGKLIEELMAKGHNVTTLASGVGKEMKKAKERGFTIVDVGTSIKNPWHITRYLFNLYRALRKSKADICLTFTIRPAIWGNIVTRYLGIPTVTNITGIGPLFTSDDIAYRAARCLYRFSLMKVAKIFFQNHDDMNMFLKKNITPSAVVERIPGSGIDCDYFAPREKKNRDGKFRFLFIGRLLRDKGIIEYVNAARMLTEELPDSEFNVLGSFWNQNLKGNSITEEEVALWVKEGVINYLGEAEDVRDHIGETDCLVLPSYREGLSNVLLEASSMEKPCIASDTVGCREIVVDGITGFHCIVQNASDLSEKMKIMCRLPEEERRTMGKKARQKMVSEYGKKIVIDAYCRVIDEIIKSKDHQGETA